MAFRPAFTLIEVLVVLGVTMALIGLALPALARSKERAGAALSLANLGQTSITLGLYSGRFDECFPIGEADALYPQDFDDEGVFTNFAHFDFGRVWPLLTLDVAPYQEFWKTWVSPGFSPSVVSVNNTSYRYSHSFLARPEVWSGQVQLDGTNWLRPVRTSEVLFPTGKVVMRDGVLAYLRRHDELFPGMWANATPMLFVDGHAAEKLPRDASPGVVNPLNDYPQWVGTPLDNTRWGVRGRDY